MNIKKLISMSIASIKSLSPKELKRAYIDIRKAVNKRVGTFKRHKAGKHLPDHVKKIPGANRLSEDEMAMSISNLSNFLNSDKFGSYNKFKKFQNQRKKILKEATGLNLDDQTYDQYTDYMNAMYERSKIHGKFHYAEAMELFAQSIRLGVNPMSFVRNYEYWLDADKIEKLADADPIATSKDNLYPSDYARKLNLPKIRGGGDYGD